MQATSHNKYMTNDPIIRLALRHVLEQQLNEYITTGQTAELFEELGIQHGSTRIDYAIINGAMCGYEIKSDRDTLERLSEQEKEFSEVFDFLTLVVGKRHLYQAIYQIPDWWGIWLAKETSDGKVTLQVIREAKQNQNQNIMSIARLLWREEALNILETRNAAVGLRSKPRESIYAKIEAVFASDINTFKNQVRLTLTSREGWRSGQPQTLCDGLYQQ